MRQIPRHKIENFLKGKDPVETKIEQDDLELRVYLTLSDKTSFLIKYDYKKQTKSYYLTSPFNTIIE